MTNDANIRLECLKPAERWAQPSGEEVREVLRLAGDYLLLMVVPVIGSVLINALMKGAPDDDEEWVEQIIEEQIGFLMGFFPLTREMTSAVQAATGFGGQFGYNGPAGLRFFSDLYKLGHAYEMPSEAVNGMKVEDVYEAVKKAADRARKGDGPTLLEMKTYRYKGHSMSDPAKYRTKEEVEEYRNQDPIQVVLNHIREKKYATDAELEKINLEVKEAVEETVKFSEESPFPQGKDLYENVYTQADYPFIMD